MNKLFCGILFLGMNQIVSADDLTVKVVPTTSNTNTGSIDLSVNNGAAPYVFEWKGPGSFSATTEDISGLAIGTYSVTVTDKYCGTATLIVKIDITSGIKPAEELISGLQLFPNPTTGQLTINTSSMLKDVKIRLLTIQGQVIREEQKISGETTSLDLSNEANGIYIIEMVVGETTSRKKIIKY